MRLRVPVDGMASVDFLWLEMEHGATKVMGVIILDLSNCHDPE